MSMLALAVAWGALLFGRAWATALLAAAAVPITVIANASRVVAIPLRKRFRPSPPRSASGRRARHPHWTATRSRSFRPTDYPVRREVDLAGRTLWLYVGYWDSQRKGASPHSPKKLSPRV